MCTPGQDEALLRGFLFHESIIDRATDLQAITLTKETDGDLICGQIDFDISKRLEGIERSGYRNASCGFCGTENWENTCQTPQIDSSWTVTYQTIQSLPNSLANYQDIFKETGGLHAAALFSIDGKFIHAEEDIGRHNALDKLTGNLLGNQQVSFLKSILLLSGRVSYEMIQKTARMEVPLVVAVGAPSSLAIDLAYQHGITLIGFSKESRFNIYTYPERIDTKILQA